MNTTSTIKHTTPEITTREAQHYVGIRTLAPAQKLDEVIPPLIDETEAWLKQRNIEPTGVPFIRYHAIDMETFLDVEVGCPVAEAVEGDDRVVAGIIPPGQYASLIYTDVTRGIEGNAVLIGWAKDNNIEWDAWDSEKGHAFRSRIELFIDGPDDDPDPTTWRTEVAIKIADDQ